MTGGYDHARPDQRPPLSLTYLKSPITVLTHSLEDGAGQDITNHDLLDAYTVLSLRIRAICAPLAENRSMETPFRALKESSNALSRRLQHDIRRALEDPLTATSQSANDILHATISRAPTESHEDLVCAARDSSALCQQSIQTVSLIFRFPALSALFARE